MNSKERVTAIVEGKPVDRCAYWSGHPHPDACPKLFEYFKINDREEMFKKLGDDVRWIIVHGQELHPYGCYADCKTAAEVDEAFQWPDPDKIDFTPRLEALKQAEGYYRIGGNLSMFFHLNCFDGFGGMENYFIKMYTDPEVVHRVTRLACDYYLKLNRRFFKEAGDSIEAYKISHDLGTQLSLLMSPEMLEEFVFPYVKEQIDLAHEFGLHSFMHSCGAIKSIVPRLIEMGVDLLHPIQALAVDMDADSLAEFKGQITFVGGIDVQELLVNGTPEEIKADVKRVSGLLGPMVISPSHESLQPDISPENVEAMSQAVME